MSEITKLYENCNIKPKQEGYCDWDSDCPYPRLKCNDECPYWKDEDEAKYPPFTAEKQIELIKFLLKNYEGIDINKKINRFNFLVDNATFIGCHHNDKSFEESLAGVINKLWADMPDEEKQQVKGILEVDRWKQCF